MCCRRQGAEENKHKDSSLVKRTKINRCFHLIHDPSQDCSKTRSYSMVPRREVGSSNKRSQVWGQPHTHGPASTSTHCLQIHVTKFHEKMKTKRICNKLKNNKNSHRPEQKSCKLCPHQVSPLCLLWCKQSCHWGFYLFPHLQKILVPSHGTSDR